MIKSTIVAGQFYPAQDSHLKEMIWGLVGETVKKGQVTK
jgi:predicted class III extradiol MEMO1 family dioxygenase